MAVIECVFDYDEKTGKVSQVIHVMGLEPSDKINFVTPYKGLTLVTEEDCPVLNLKKGDYAPIRWTRKPPKTGRKVPKFVVYYHGPQGHFKCGEASGNGFTSWATGQPSPRPGTP
jgi:hypothetical protein